MRVGEAGEETPAIYLDDGTIRDLTGVVPDIAGDVLLPDTMKVLAGYDFTRCPVVDAEIRVGPCVGNIGKFICIGLNYEDHARETNAPIPEEPVVFSKWTSAINGPNDAIIKPLGSKKLDWEVELGIVLGGGGDLGGECRDEEGEERERHRAGHNAVAAPEFTPT